MSVFHFKKFNVRNDRSAMKVNTDGVLLGICAPMQPSDRQILDIGTGTGTAALVLAQRLNGAAMEDGAGFTGIDAMITGIEIDEDAAAEAGENFRGSPWSGILNMIRTAGSTSLSRIHHITTTRLLTRMPARRLPDIPEADSPTGKSWPSPKQGSMQAAGCASYSRPTRKRNC